MSNGPGDRPRRDVLAFGGSAGALPALMEIFRQSPPPQHASVFVVLHRGDGSGGLVDVLRGKLGPHVVEPADGAPIEAGWIYLAPAGCHMMLGDGHIHVRRGPRENNFRPSIDPLFRSAAVFAGHRTTAVLLSGLLDDGASGLRALRACGGRVVVQDPLDALHPDMPRAAISALGEPDAILSAADIGAALDGWTSEPAGEPSGVPDTLRLEVTIAGLQEASIENEDRLGRLTPYNCPDCNGVLWEIRDGPAIRFRCHTGHAFTGEALVAAQSTALERSLYDVLRAQRERAALLKELAEKEKKGRERWRRRARDYERDAALIERLILSQSEVDTSTPDHLEEEERA